MRQAVLVLLLVATVRAQSPYFERRPVKREPSRVAAGVYRLAGGSWLLRAEDGSVISPEVKLSGLQRVVALDKQSAAGSVFVTAWQGGRLVAGLLPAASLGPGAAATAAEERSAFHADAELTLQLAARLDNGLAPAYSVQRGLLEKKLACLQPALVSGSGWENFKKQDEAGLAVDLKDKVETLRRLMAAVFAGFDPTVGTKTIRQETLIVPLSRQWFQTTPALEQRFQAQFMNGSWDPKIAGGSSGEGISGISGKPDTWKEFDRYKNELFSLKAFTASLRDPAVAATPEYRWLQALDEAAFSGKSRLIFIHEHAWALQPGAGWADYIAIDQSFGPLQGQPLLSILIHEINVNSHDPFFLPTDTHQEREAAQALWVDVAKKGPEQLKDPRALSVFLALNPHLGTAALGYHLDVLARAAGSCR